MAEAAESRNGNTKRRVVAAVLVAAAAAGWYVGFDDVSMPPYAALGAYSNKWMAVNFALTWIAAIAVVLAIRPPGRKGLMGMIAVHLVLGLLFGGAELASLALGVDFSGVFRSSMQWEREDADQWTLPNQSIEGEAPTDLAFVFGIDVPLIPFSFQTDSHGLRNPKEKPDPGVVCLGDSILIAGLVPVEETVTERLENTLGVDVLNVSKIGYSPEESLARWESTEIDPGGRLFLHFVFEGNDVSDSARYRRQYVVADDLPWRATPADKQQLRWPVRGLARSLVSMLHSHKRSLPEYRMGVFAGDRKIYYFYDGENIDDGLHDLTGLMEVLEAADEHFRAAGSKYAIVYVPSKISTLHAFCEFPEQSTISAPEMGNPKLAAALREACDAAGIPFLDTTPGLRAVAENGELPFFEADTHLSPRGHAELASLVSPYARELLNELRR